MKDNSQFVVAVPARSVCDDNARALQRVGCLKFLALGTRSGTAGVSSEHTRLNPGIGLATYLFGRFLSPYWGEYCRFHLHPWFDHWVRRQLTPGDHIISSYGHTNASFRWVRQHGGKTFLDGGNSHPDNFWAILSEEHRRWNCEYPPVPPHHYRRSMEMMEEVDYVLSPSVYVTKSFLDRGFSQDRIIPNVYPLDLTCFTPAESRPANRPLTLINTGSLSIRKGTPYMLEAFRIIRRKAPNARFLLTSDVASSAKPIVEKYSDLPIEWAPPLRHPQLAERLRSADIFVLPSLEEGFARTQAEAIACGLPSIGTFNTGSADLIRNGENGQIVPIRDPNAIAEAVLEWWERIQASSGPQTQFDRSCLSHERFTQVFLSELRKRHLIPDDSLGLTP